MFNGFTDKKMMSTLIILYCDKNSDYGFQFCFHENSALDNVLYWAREIPDSKIVIFYTEKQKSLVERHLLIPVKIEQMCEKDEWTFEEMLENSYNLAEKYDSKDIIFTFADLPFINLKLTEKILESHRKFSAEYSFADGYSYGFAPEVLAKDTLKILLSMLKNKPEADKILTRTSIFDLIKTEINSFEIETVIAEKDYRMARLNLDCSSKSNFYGCYNFSELRLESDDVEFLNEKAVNNIGTRKTFPTYYSIQVSEKCTKKCIICPYSKVKNDEQFIDFWNFRKLCDEISSYSEEAVICLGNWGEPFEHPDIDLLIKEVIMHSGLRVLIETDGLKITEEIAKHIYEITSFPFMRKNDKPKVMWIVALDAFSKEKYSEIRGIPEENFEKALKSVEILNKYFPGNVYPQMTRINQNENELESFYRFWSDKNSPSGGKFIVQKYDNFCKSLPDLRPADISPLERNVCWHLLKDFNILADGTVTLCHEIFDKSEKDYILGNVFTDGIQKLWEKQTEFAKEQFCKKYNKKCGECDEYYTFNF